MFNVYTNITYSSSYFVFYLFNYVLFNYLKCSPYFINHLKYFFKTSFYACIFGVCPQHPSTLNFQQVFIFMCIHVGTYSILFCLLLVVYFVLNFYEVILGTYSIFFCLVLLVLVVYFVLNFYKKLTMCTQEH